MRFFLKTTRSAAKDIGRTTTVSWFETGPAVDKQNVSLYHLAEDESVISASSLSSLSAYAHDRDGDDFGVEVINQGCFPCLLAARSSLLSPIHGCLYLNNKALISVNYYSAGHCIDSISHRLPLPLSSSPFSLHHTPPFIFHPDSHLSLSHFLSTEKKVYIVGLFDRAP